MQSENPDSNYDAGEAEFSPVKFIKIGKNSIFYWLASILPKLAGLLLLPIYTRFMTPTDYGILAMLGVIAQPLGIIFSLQLNTAVLRFFFQYEGDDRKNYLGTIFLFFTIYALPISLCLILFGKPLFGIIFRSEELSFYPFVVWQIIISYLSLAWVIPSVIFKARQEAMKWTAFSLAAFVLGTSLTFYFIIVHGEGAMGVIRASLIGQSVMAAIYLYIISRNISFRMQWDKLKESLIFCMPLFPGALTGFLYAFSDRWFIERFWTLGDVGLYSLALSFSRIPQMLYAATGDAWMPVFFDTANKDEARAKHLLARTVTFWAAFGGLVVLAMGFFVREVIALMTTPQFYPAHAVVPILAFNVLLMGIRFYPRYALLFVKKTKALLIITLVTTGVSFSMNYLLIPGYGMFGAAYSGLIANVASVVVTFWLLHRYFPVKLEYAALAKVMGMVIALLVASSLFSTGELYVDIPVKIGGLLLYVLGLINFGIIRKSWLVKIKDNFNLESIIRMLKE